jgi:hypothetical protein
VRGIPAALLKLSRRRVGLITVRLGLLVLLSLVMAAEPKTLLWRNPGPIESLDLAAGPARAAGAPKAPFTFIKEVSGGIAPKIVVADARRMKWMVKFGQEAKPETFASRVAWAAGYPTRVSYYVSKGKVEGASGLHRAADFIDSNGEFRGARFQMFDNEQMLAIPGGKLDLNNRRDDQRELNGLKLLLLLLANWDVKTANTGVFDIGGRRYSVITDWGASLGDPASTDIAARKWDCAAFDKRTASLIEGVENGYVYFNYLQYAARHEHALSEGIRVEDMKWFMNRMGRLTDGQLRAGLTASGATVSEAACFTSALRKRLNMFAQAAEIH